MRLLLLAHSFNSLTQRLFVELAAAGHELSVEFDIHDAVTEEAVALWRPEVVIAPFLKRAIPASVWRKVPCLVVHPGPKGDRGPAALDWAILEGARSWGVTVLQADGELDAGDVWDSRTFQMRNASKSSLYRNEVTEAAVAAVFASLEKMRAGERPEPGGGPWRPKPPRRSIDWSRDFTTTVLRKIRSADGSPGPLYDVHPEPELRGAPGRPIARRCGAVCRATTDGAVWIGHARTPEGLKLPAADRFGESLPEVGSYRDLWYEETRGVGTLHFPFYNGAMSTDRCERLRRAFVEARERPTRAIVLFGGPDFWSNGIHLGTIEAAESPADESWHNINAMNDLAREILTTESHLTIAALQGNAGAGGVFLALAADIVWARTGIVLNPHYKSMGNLYGSEYWTYLLPRRAGPEKARAVVDARLPMGTAEALRLGLIDDRFGSDAPSFRREVERRANALAQDPALSSRLAEKRRDRAADEARKPLEAYRAEELERMKLNFYGFDPSYHVARYNFVFKVPKSRTPLYLARHRRGVVLTESPPRAVRGSRCRE